MGEGIRDDSDYHGSWCAMAVWQQLGTSVLRSHQMEAAVVRWKGDGYEDGGESACACELPVKPVTELMISV